MSIKPAIAEPEFSHPLSIEKISTSGTIKTLEANGEERRRLAERFELLDLPKLNAELEVHLARGGKAFAVTGHMTADVVQKCVVTLEPLPAHIEHEIEMLYVMEEAELSGSGEINADEVEMEVVKNGAIDLGELVTQNLGVALDPYPRKPGVAFQGPAEDIGKPAINPLADLAKKINKDK